MSKSLKYYREVYDLIDEHGQDCKLIANSDIVERLQDRLPELISQYSHSTNPSQELTRVTKTLEVSSILYSRPLQEPTCGLQ